MDRGPAGRLGEAVFGLPSAVFSDHQRASHNFDYPMRVYVALFTALLVVTVIVVVPAQAQVPLGPHRLCLAADPCDPLQAASDTPLGYAKEDWSLRYASGRAHLSTLVPMALGSVLLRIHLSRSNDASLGDPLAVTGLSLSGAGAIVGPAMGTWCLKSDCAGRSWLPLGLRVAGVGGIAGAWWWIKREIDRADGLGGIGLIAVAPLVLLPGALALTAGIGWSFRTTPRIRCSSTADAPTLEVAPAAAPDGGSGLALRLRL